MSSQSFGQKQEDLDFSQPIQKQFFGKQVALLSFGSEHSLNSQVEKQDHSVKKKKNQVVPPSPSFNQVSRIPEN